jgi:hypothetical protein
MKQTAIAFVSLRHLISSVFEQRLLFTQQLFFGHVADLHLFLSLLCSSLSLTTHRERSAKQTTRNSPIK